MKVKVVDKCYLFSFFPLEHRPQLNKEFKTHACMKSSEPNKPSEISGLLTTMKFYIASMEPPELE